jgi:hypothetical protein
MAAIKDFTFETGAVITDATGEVTITLSCFTPSDNPCVVLSSYDLDGNSNVNLYDLSVVTGSWTAKVITSSPTIKVYYHAFSATKISAIPVEANNLITQDLFDIITQGGELIITQ